MGSAVCGDDVVMPNQSNDSSLDDVTSHNSSHNSVRLTGFR
jgi:hypothetical protein